MRRVIAAINMTVDGYCDHTAIVADDELHNHFSDVLPNGDVILYGRITYQLMEDYWPLLIENPGGVESDDEFARVIDGIPKIVFSSTMKKVKWKSAKLATKSLEEELSDLKKQPGGNILVGSRSLMIRLLNQGLIDEFQLTVHPVIAGGGLALFEKIVHRIELRLKKAKQFASGAVTYYYEPVP